MNIIKCKMCGGDIEVNQDMTVGTCLYCGSTMTFPRIDSEKKARIFNRANEYRLNNEFDKAFDAYERIIEEDDTEAEAYWGLVLSEYGVEYVEDPNSRKRIPTCHRAKEMSVLTSTNYKMALKYADTENRFLYQDEAEELDRIQKKILYVSNKEEPYDVFICYKETDEITGERTRDSVVAQDIYDALSEKGIRCFFSRISLEEHVGENFEPYIYSALNSSRVMIVVSSSIENCNAVWVKNEWMRYLKLMEEDKNRTIIPACVDIQPNELPSELYSLQAQDMNKIGAIQDLTRGVYKLLSFFKTSTIPSNQIIEKQKKEKKIKARYDALMTAYIAFSVLAIIAIAIYGQVTYNNIATLSYGILFTRFRFEFILFSSITLLGLIFSNIGVFRGIYKNKKKALSLIFADIGSGLSIIAFAVMKIRCFSFNIFFISIIALQFIALLIVVLKIKKDIKIYNIIISGVLGVSLIVVGLLPGRSTQICNPVEIGENTLVVTGQYCDLRKDHDDKSFKIGELYEGMTFQIEELNEYNGNKWFKITTADGKTGYVEEFQAITKGDTRTIVATNALKAYIIGNGVWARKGKDESSDGIKEYNDGDELYVLDTNESGNRRGNRGRWDWDSENVYVVPLDGEKGYIFKSFLNVPNSNKAY